MKNILVPTDFSKHAEFAFDAALQLARKFDAHLHLVTIPAPGFMPATGGKAEAGTPAANEAERLEQKMRDWGTMHPDLSFRYFVGFGKLVDVLTSYVDEHGIELIVMGSHGASGKSEYFVGSNTQKVVRSVHCPVLVVKDKLEDIKFDKVIFASNFNKNEENAFLKFKHFIKHFVPEIHLVMVHTSSLFDPPYTLSKEVMKDFQQMCEPFQSEIHIYRDFTVEQGIRSFAEEIGAKLIAMSNHNRHPLKRMLIGSNVEALVNHSHLPVLSIDYDQGPADAEDSTN